MSPDSLASMLLRKADWHDEEGVLFLLEHGADPNRTTRWGFGALHQAAQIGGGSTALHAAAWRAQHATVRLLLERGAPVDAGDARGRTPLVLAVRACVDSYWTDVRSPESVRALLAAGASPDGVAYPCGYADVDELLRPARG